MSQTASLQEIPVWDRTTRWFHWINVLTVLALIAIGVVILNSKALGVTNEGKILLKTWHVYIGYVFTLNLLWRLIWGFIGGRYSRWRNILPFGQRYKQQQQAFIEGMKSGQATGFKGHNPPGRWMVTVLLLLLTTQAITGLVLAGTDVYKPPFGQYFKAWVAESPDSMALVRPYADDGVNEASFKEMRAFRSPFKDIHEINFFLIVFCIVLHIVGVVVAEVRERNGLVSAMFSGNKVFREKPLDDDD